MSLCIDHRFRKTIKSDESYHRAKFESGKREIFEFWHENGIKLPYIKLDRRVFYKRDSIKALVNSLEVNSIASTNTNTIVEL